MILRVSRFRTLKFQPKIVTSMRPHGKWGDLIVCLIPVFWCANILINSAFLLRMLEWQNESTLFTLRVRGKQWYWIYKFDVRDISQIFSANKNVGHNKWMSPSHGSLENQNDYLRAVQIRYAHVFLEKYWVLLKKMYTKEHYEHMVSASELPYDKEDLDSVLSNVISKRNENLDMCINFMRDNMVSPVKFKKNNNDILVPESISFKFNKDIRNLSVKRPVSLSTFKFNKNKGPLFMYLYKNIEGRAELKSKYFIRALHRRFFLIEPYFYPSVAENLLRLRVLLNTPTHYYIDLSRGKRWALRPTQRFIAPIREGHAAAKKAVLVSSVTRFNILRKFFSSNINFIKFSENHLDVLPKTVKTNLYNSLFANRLIPFTRRRINLNSSLLELSKKKRYNYTNKYLAPLLAHDVNSLISSFKHNSPNKSKYKINIFLQAFAQNHDKLIKNTAIGHIINNYESIYSKSTLNYLDIIRYQRSLRIRVKLLLMYLKKKKNIVWFGKGLLFDRKITLSVRKTSRLMELQNVKSRLHKDHRLFISFSRFTNNGVFARFKLSKHQLINTCYVHNRAPAIQLWTGLSKRLLDSNLKNFKNASFAPILSEDLLSWSKSLGNYPIDGEEFQFKKRVNIFAHNFPASLKVILNMSKYYNTAKIYFDGYRIMIDKAVLASVWSCEYKGTKQYFNRGSPIRGALFRPYHSTYWPYKTWRKVVEWSIISSENKDLFSPRDEYPKPNHSVEFKERDTRFRFISRKKLPAELIKTVQKYRVGKTLNAENPEKVPTDSVFCSECSIDGTGCFIPTTQSKVAFDFVGPIPNFKYSKSHRYILPIKSFYPLSKDYLNLDIVKVISQFKQYWREAYYYTYLFKLANTRSAYCNVYRDRLVINNYSTYSIAWNKLHRLFSTDHRYTLPRLSNNLFYTHFGRNLTLSISDMRLRQARSDKIFFKVADSLRSSEFYWADRNDVTKYKKCDSCTYPEFTSIMRFVSKPYGSNILNLESKIKKDFSIDSYGLGKNQFNLINFYLPIYKNKYSSDFFLNSFKFNSTYKNKFSELIFNSKLNGGIKFKFKFISLFNESRNLGNILSDIAENKKDTFKKIATYVVPFKRSMTFEDGIRWLKRGYGIEGAIRVFKLDLTKSSTELFKVKFYEEEELLSKNVNNNPYFVMKQKRYTPKKSIATKKVLLRTKARRDVSKPELLKYTQSNLYLRNQLPAENIDLLISMYRFFQKNRRRNERFSVITARRMLRTRRTLVLPAHTNISVITNSFDVVHSWFIPGLGIKFDCIPGRATHHTFYIDNVGFYYGQCAEVCGRYHHHMPIRVCVLPFDQFLVWWHHFGLPKLTYNGNKNRIRSSHINFRKYSW